MKLKLNMSCHKLNAYTKFQIDISKHVEKKSGKLGQTDGQTDRRMDRHRHGIIRPFFKRAYNNGHLKILTAILVKQHNTFKTNIEILVFYHMAITKYWLLFKLRCWHFIDQVCNYGYGPWYNKLIEVFAIFLSRQTLWGGDGIVHYIMAGMYLHCLDQWQALMF